MSKPQTSPTPGRALPNPKGSPGMPNGQPKVAPSAGFKKGSGPPPQANNNSSSSPIITIQKYARRSLAMGNLIKLQTLERLRKQVIQELLDTERAYFKYLEQAISYYMIPIRENNMIKNAQIIALFKSFEEIQRVNKLILVALEKRMAQWKGLPKNQQRLGDIFTQLSPFLKVYSEYVTNYQTHITTINEKLNDSKMVVFLKKCSASVDAKYDQGQTIQSLLIMPIQRIPRYELLLREVLKYTNVEYSDYTELNKALLQVQQVANHINGIVKERQNLEKILTIQKSIKIPTGSTVPAGLVELGRQFVHEGKLTKVCRKDNQERYFFLFTDALLYTKEQGDGKYEARGFLELEGAKAEDLPDKDDQKNRFGLATAKKSFIVFASTPQEKNKWLDMFKSVLDLLDKKLEDSKARKSIALNVSNTISRDSVKPGAVDDEESDENDQKNAAYWKPDSEAPDCPLCHKKWTPLFRRHHCRKCGEVVCKNCSGNKLLLKHINENKKVRVCDPCYSKATGDTSSLNTSSPRLSTSPNSPKLTGLNGSSDKVVKHKSFNNIKDIKKASKEEGQAGDRMTHTFGAPTSPVSKEKEKEKEKEEKDKEKDGKEKSSPSLFKKLSNKFLGNNSSVNNNK